MRVAYQAGVLRAFEEAGLSFSHADGTSGGTINLAMLLSGLSPLEMCDRWRTLRVRDFASPPPLRDLLRGPRIPAFGGADGIVGKVFPHLGIEVDRIRAARGLQGTFNVCNHSTKQNEAIEHQRVDLDLLVAGISLPVLMPAVGKGAASYLDAVWVKDANLTEAVKRGAEELWLVWCIGNTAEYRDGPFNQYVHMIEQSANGVLFEELDRIREINAGIRAGHSPYGQRRPIVLHVVCPRHPLPLDPDLFFGRIDPGTLTAMGHRDAYDYFATMNPQTGMELDATATAMERTGPRPAWRERLSGHLTGPRPVELSLELSAEIEDVSAFAAGRETAPLVGRLSAEGIGEGFLRDGTVQLLDGGSPALAYEAGLVAGGHAYHLSARRAAPTGGTTLDRLRALAPLEATLEERRGGHTTARGTLHPGAGTTGWPLGSLRVTRASSIAERVRTANRAGRLVLGGLLPRPG
jgi:predicted acylesterase/phospholipase RssA